MELLEILAHGKSTVCKEILKISNSKIVDADKIVKSMDFPGSKYIEEIEKLFGRKVINSDKTLNRQALGNIIYNDFEKKLELDKITFKHVVKKMNQDIEILSKENLDFILIDAPLLFEAEIDKKCDFIISVLAKEKLKIDRICKRDNLSIDVAKSRLSVQKKDEFFIQNSDFIIENNGNIEEIKKDVERILKSIK